MRKRTLGQGLEVSAVGFGCMGLSHAYGAALEEAEGIRRIREAVEIGYTLFDTAQLYVGRYPDGTPAVNEELVGKALAPVRDSVVIATKGGVAFRDDPHHASPCGSPENLRRSVDASLSRMGLETIDLYYQHMQDPEVEPEAVAETMDELMKAGKIRHWGVSNVSADYIRRAHAVCPLCAVQDRLSLMARWNEPLFPLLDELGVGFVAYSPLANGFLTGRQDAGAPYDRELDFRSAMPQYTEEGVAKAAKLTEMVEALASDKGATPAQVSLAWMMGKRPYVVPIPGTKRRERMEENAGAADAELSAEEIEGIDAALDGMELDVFGKRKES